MKLTWLSIFLTTTLSLFAEGPEIVCNENPLCDTELAIEVNGLRENQVVLIEASWVDHQRVQWVSEAVFQAGPSGRVDLSRQSPITGSYKGVDPMGLFWSMESRNVLPFSETDEEVCGSFCFANRLRVYDGKKLVAEKTICRCLQMDDLHHEILDEDGLVGRLFMPEVATPRPLVIVLTGSNGGIQASTAALIASHGIPALALAYTGIGDLPPTVENVPLEYFEKAFEWVENHPQLNGEIFLHGTSRGAELALVLGSYFPDKIHKIVAIAPSSVVLSADSWLYEDEAILPAAPFFIDMNNDTSVFESTRDNPRSIRVHRERGLYLERENFDKAAIPVENIQCPILLISGGDDQLGPCSVYSELILERLEEHDSEIRCEHLDFPKAGHLISEPYFPRCNVYCTDGMWMDYGGTPKADELASREAWKRTIEFFKEP
ncbi:MAG: acyl-CoA thioesterase/bile acid-CoA:amino acid N-acyltransferase family protein [Simkaniaceae bacterium]|nr:acyl-CoA thioesterase/bile acid-CoA:amino acid N-acyltransferase family protein [Candidatus Sacchlamyda saccharinae]